MWLENARLISALLIRKAQHRGLPVFICTDLNEDPSESPIISAVRSTGATIDIVEDWVPSTPPTFKHGQVFEGMTHEKGATRIDTIMGNQAAAALVESS